MRRNDIEEEGDANIIITRIIENKNPFNLYITTNIYIHQNHHHHLMNARARLLVLLRLLALYPAALLQNSRTPRRAKTLASIKVALNAKGNIRM